MESQINEKLPHVEDYSSEFYLPEHPLGISYLFVYGCQPEVFQNPNSDVQNNLIQAYYGIVFLNAARLERHPFYRYVFYYKNGRTFQEKLDWFPVSEVKDRNAQASINLQLREAIKWAAAHGVYNLQAPKVVKINQDKVINLPSLNIKSYGYVAIFTDFTLCQKTGNIQDELEKYPVDAALLSVILVSDPRPEDLLYPEVKTAKYPDSRYRSLVQSYINRIHEIYNAYFNLSEVAKKEQGIIYILIMKEYARMAREISYGRKVLYPAHATPYKYEIVSKHLLKAGLIPDQNELIDKIISMPTPTEYNVPYLSSFLQKVWASLQKMPDATPNIDNFINGLKYRSYLRTSQALFTGVNIPGTKFDVSQRQVEIDSMLADMQKILVQNPEKDVRYQALFLNDLDVPDLYKLASDPLMYIK